MKLRTNRRRGLVLVIILALLVAILAVMGTMTWTMVASRKYLGQRERRYQAEWLLRGAIERAHAQTLRGDAPAQGDWRPIENGAVAIEVKTNDTAWDVTCTATYPTDEPTRVVRERTASLPR